MPPFIARRMLARAVAKNRFRFAGFERALPPHPNPLSRGEGDRSDPDGRAPPFPTPKKSLVALRSNAEEMLFGANEHPAQRHGRSGVTQFVKCVAMEDFELVARFEHDQFAGSRNAE